MKLKNLKKKKFLGYLLILTAIILLIVPSIRFFYYDNLQIGEQPYYNIRMAQYILEKGLFQRDYFIDAPYLFQPIHFLLAGLAYFFGIGLAAFFLPFLSGIISAVLFYYILKELKINYVKRFAALLILVISPIFVYTFSTLNSYSLSIVFLLLAFFLFVKKQKIFFNLSFFLYILISFFNSLTIIFSLLILFIYSLNYHKKIKRFHSIFIVVVFISLMRAFFYLFKYGLPYISFSSEILINYLTELGGLLSFGIFNLILFGIGSYIEWENKKQILGYIFLFTAIVFSFYFNSINIYLNFIFALFAGSAFVSLIKMRYSVNIIKKLTISLLFFGLIFSTITYSARVSTLPPDKSVVDSLNWLKENTDPGEIVLSYYTKGNWIETIAERPVLLDLNLLYIKGVKMKLNDTKTIFYSRNLKQTTDLIRKYNISYIWIDSEMKKELVWIKDDEGLLFLFSNKDIFKREYEKDGIEIWEISKRNLN